MLSPQSSVLITLYTYNLRGDLARLPRLYTFLRQLRREAAGDVLLLDLGDSCAPEVWPCEVTEGRSTLIALDAMGYHAANVEGILTDSSRDKLSDQVSLALVDLAHPQMWKNIALTCENPPLNRIGDSSPLTISLCPAPAVTLMNQTLTLAAINARQVGSVMLSGDPFTLENHTVHDLPSTTPADSTIAGVIDYIRAEARLYGNRQNKP